ncbi:hypothetical protein PWR63_04595 [Paraburkholderia sp. A2WS-5]|uniref:hypothetical protein n=1 Tax=Paraburkholderia sp. A2WS-5 TaxID=3028372 RepID=UPI003B7DC412
MSGEAFDQLLSRLGTEDRERIHQMAMAYGLTFDDPSWVPFAITQMTLDQLKAQIEEVAQGIENAADHALRKIGNKAQAVTAQVQAITEAQSIAFKRHHDALRALEQESIAHYQKLLADLSAESIGRLVEEGAIGIASDVSQELTGEHGMLARSAVAHATALDQARQRFVSSVDAAVLKVDDAGRIVAESMRRGVRHTVYFAVGTIVLCTLAISAFVIFWGGHQLSADVPSSGPWSTPQRALPAHPHR